MTFKTKLTTAIATGAVLLNALAPIALAETITVTGNGALSNNTVNVVNSSATIITQNNNANVINDIDANASTGGNSASFNTGGTTAIVTGNAETNVDVTTKVNLNKVDLKDCGPCDGEPVNITISKNGAESDNNVDVNKSSTLFITQDNNANINNDIDAKASTGKNDSSFNTGDDSIIKTGNATTNVSVDNMANANIAKVGGGNSNGNGSSLNITGNGANSDNNVDLDVNSLIILDQLNEAKILNDVDAKAKTGKNDSSFNTGGGTILVTGNAETEVDVDNMVNFNAAKIDCECILEDLKAKIGGNGAESENQIDVSNNDTLFDTQDNLAGLLNDVDGKAKTGFNDVSFSTGDTDNDPVIKTGNASSSTEVDNSGNVNLFNEGSSLQLPGGMQIEFEFKLEHLMHLIHLG